MPDKTVALPDGRVIAFPDSMSDADISAIIAKHANPNAGNYMQAPGGPIRNTGTDPKLVDAAGNWTGPAGGYLMKRPEESDSQFMARVKAAPVTQEAIDQETEFSKRAAPVVLAAADPAAAIAPIRVVGSAGRTVAERLFQTAEGEPSGFLDALTHPGKIPEVILNRILPKAEPVPSKIVLPGSEPPPVPVTYPSVPRSQLFEMAKKGDIRAGLELIRNPKGFELPPNFKYLIEGSAKRIPYGGPE